MSPTTIPKYKKSKSKTLSASAIVRIAYTAFTIFGAALAVIYILNT